MNHCSPQSPQSPNLSQPHTEISSFINVHSRQCPSPTASRPVPAHHPTMTKLVIGALSRFPPVQARSRSYPNHQYSVLLLIAATNPTLEHKNAPGITRTLSASSIEPSLRSASLCNPPLPTPEVSTLGFNGCSGVAASSTT